MNLTQLQDESRGLYGLDRTAAEDARFTDAQMTPLINRAHHWLTELVLPYYKTFTANLTSGTNVYSADSTVIAIDLTSVRVQQAGAWTTLRFRHRHSLLQEYEALEAVSAGTALYVTTLGGNADNQVRRFEIWPAHNATVSNGLKYDAWIYGTDLSAGADVPELQPAEHYRLLNGICWQMALLERSLGRTDAPVDEWQELAMADAIALAENVLKANPGTPNVAWQMRQQGARR